MRPSLGSTALLLLAASEAGAEQQRFPTAIRKMPLDSSKKLLREHLAFQDDAFPTNYEPHPFLSPREAILAARLQLTVEEDLLLATNSSSISRPHRPAFNTHKEDAPDDGWLLFRRAREALHLLQSRQGCPGGMMSCESVGFPNKCCSSDEVCTQVNDPNVGNVACCPAGADCDAPVGGCPDGASECPAELGGGCCIPGFVCQGVGCVPSPAPTPVTTSHQLSTITTTSTTTADGGEPSTVVVTVIITASPPEPEPSTITTTQTVTPSRTSSAGIVPPMRPTSDQSIAPTTTDEPEEPEPSGLPEDYCPTGFYQCLARQGGGCCRTGRDCSTFDCPTTASTTITTDGATVVVPLTDVPEAQATETCADGWFMCGADAGPVAGCCPSGYECGVASCTTVQASQTEAIQKMLPDSGARAGASLSLVLVLGAVVSLFILG
ncbi:hypothetical protein B0T11DRAFT_103700 [Plectosphaerella cucumerina]|uniref:Gpi anchored protein n=1 Tax=Plectosphaerella cucumerina TaxID=40658 RepID=A0A8K0TE10_9PEZI|nr:hypothetical protein B0T11DRAFT_103700 [Plectosphaerella cucumerina]